jgi:alanyl-tRNA synthetase
VLAILKGGKEASSAGTGDEAEIILDRTPFYGEAGGQVGDTGWLIRNGMKLRVTNTLKFNQGLIVHQGRMEGGAISLGENVEAKVDEEKRTATALNHTATHLLHAALREILGDHVKQAGSLVAPGRFRFDFSHFTQVDHEKLKEVERLVNKYITENLPVSSEELPKDEAMKSGAIAIFEERYGDRVRLVRVGDGISMELCGGTHTTRTGDIGVFKIIQESAVGANVRRIEALTAKAALDHIQGQDDDLRSVASSLKTTPDQIKDRVERLLREQKHRERELESLRAKLLSSESGDLLEGMREVSGTKVLAREVGVESPKELREFADRVKEKLQSGVIVLGSKNAGKALLICLVTKDLHDRYHAGEIIRRLSEIVGGKGGGRKDMAQGGGSKPEALGQALESVGQMIEEAD